MTGVRNWLKMQYLALWKMSKDAAGGLRGGDRE